MTLNTHDKKSFVLAFILFSNIFTFCSTNEDKLVLATFSGGDVSIDEYLEQYLSSSLYKPKMTPTEDNLKKIVFNKALEKISVQEAIELNIDHDSLYVSVLTNNTRRLLYQKYIQENIVSTIITDSLIDKFYNEFTPQYRMKYIMRPFLKTSSENFIKSQEQSIDEAYNALLTGKSFKEVVETYSQDISSNKKEGDIGWVIRESLGGKELRSVMDTLKESTFSKPFKGYGGYYIMYKGEKRDVKVPPFDVVKHNIWKTLYHSRRPYIEDRVDKEFDELISKYKYVRLDNNIDQFLNAYSPNQPVSESTELNFDKITPVDQELKIASYNGGYVKVGDLFANKKKSPGTKYEFYASLNNISQQHLFAKKAQEIGMDDIPELKTQLNKMKTSLLSSVLHKKFVKDPAEEEVKALQSSQQSINKVKVRSEIEERLRAEYEDKISSKYNFKYLDSNFSEALEIAALKKEEQNRNKRDSS